MNTFFKKALSMILVGAMLFGLVSTATASRKEIIEEETDSNYEMSIDPYQEDEELPLEEPSLELPGDDRGPMAITYVNVGSQTITRSVDYGFRPTAAGKYTISVTAGTLYFSGTQRTNPVTVSLSDLSGTTSYYKINVSGSGSCTLNIVKEAPTVSVGSQTIDRSTTYKFKPPVSGKYVMSFTGTGTLTFNGSTRTNPCTVNISSENNYSLSLSGTGTSTFKIEAYVEPTPSVVIGSNSINMSQEYTFTPPTATVYEFAISGASGALIQIGSSAKTVNPYRTSLSAGSTYKIKVNPASGTGGTCTLKIIQGCSINSITPVSNVHNTTKIETNRVTFNTTDLAKAGSQYVTALTSARNTVNNSTDFTVELSTNSGWPVVVENNASSTFAAVASQDPDPYATNYTWLPIISGKLRVNIAKASTSDARVMVHELGHFAGLRDIKKVDNAMPGCIAYDGIEYYHWMMYGNHDSNFTSSEFNSTEIAAIRQKATTQNRRTTSSEETMNQVQLPETYETILDVVYETETLSGAVELADYAVVGKVVSVSKEVQSEDGYDVYRIASIEVSEDLMDTAPAIIDVRLYGGVYEGRRYTYNGAPDFTEGDSVVVLLKEQPKVEGGRREVLSDAPECMISGGEFAFGLDARSPMDAAGSNAIIDMIKEEINNK